MSNLCERCQNEIGSYEGVTLSDGELSEQICQDCLNKEMAQTLGIDINPALPKILTFKDSESNEHRFKIIMRVFPMGIHIEAVEIDGVYKIAVSGESDCNQRLLMEKLIGKIRMTLAKKHIKYESFHGSLLPSIKDFVVAGRIEPDLDEDNTPLFIIDGKAFTLQEFGQMLMTYEGFQFKMTMHDITEDI